MLAKPGKDDSNPSSYRSKAVLNSIRKLFEEVHTKSQSWWEVTEDGLYVRASGVCPKTTKLSKATGDAYLGTKVTPTANMRPPAVAAHEATRANLTQLGSIASPTVDMIRASPRSCCTKPTATSSSALKCGRPRTTLYMWTPSR